MTTNSVIEGRSQGLSQPAAIVLAALLLGVAADYLFWPEGPASLALVLWLALFSAVISGFSWYRQMPWRLTVALLSAVSVVAALLLLFRDTDILFPALLGIMFAAGLQILLRTAGIGFPEARIAHFFPAALLFPLQAGFGLFPVLTSLDIASNWASPRTRAITRGLLLALPLLVLFIALFSSADAGFSRYVPDLSAFFNPDTPAHLALIAVFFAISGGLLAGVLKTRTLTAIEVPPGKLGAEETGIVLGLLSALFVAFVLMQLRYLFGGQETIETTTGLTVAEYARRGFFELLWVAILTLTLLLIVARTSRAPHLLRLFGSLMVACVLIMLVSAVQRMLLYIDSFGLSIERVVACTVMAWLACCLLLCGFTVLTGKDKGFASGMANLGIAFCFLLIVMNPGRLVASVNIDRSLEQRQPLDIYYLLGLGSDVIPPLLAQFDNLAERSQCEIAIGLLDLWSPEGRTRASATSKDWRSWNYSRNTAMELIDANRVKLQNLYDNAQQKAREHLSRGNALSFGANGCHI